MAHTHIILIGGMVNMIIGVASWVFPRSKKGYRFYNPRFMWLLYWILTFATLGRFGVEIAAGYVPHQALLKTGFFASILQVSVLAGIFFQLWDRVVTKGSHIREALGETF
jgi:hypothetical protein